MIRFGASICHDLAHALSREWLETNGLGGYASSTIVGANTRRYHALLVAATRPPVGRLVLLSKLEERLAREEVFCELSCNLYPDAVHPEGYRHLSEFRLDPFPTFTYLADDVCLVKRVFMIHGYNATAIQYELTEADHPVRLLLRPLVAARGHHQLQHWNDVIRADMQLSEGRVVFSPYGEVTTLRLTYDRGEFAEAPDWYYSFDYPRERDRGLDYREDLFSLGLIVLTLEPGETASVIASHGDPPPMNASEAADRERERRQGLRSARGDPRGAGGRLSLAADAFMARRGTDQRSIIAGYHWFADWGRDAMIALPGLLLATRRFAEARDVLASFAAYCDRGMIPNVFPEGDNEPAYNTVDASLWFVHAARAYVDASGDMDFVADRLWEPLKQIIHHYRHGTRHNIRMDDDGLIMAGDSATQLTWMDAKVGDWVVTPRHGKCVEINALWYNALRHMAHFCARLREDRLGEECTALAKRTRESFEATFWNEALGCLYDCVRPGELDAAIRPNQVFAVSLPYSLLAPEKEQRVMEVVRRELLTPVGLRTLSPSDPAYVGRYEGDQTRRDGAYHQGTVWAWLMGPYLTAWLKVNAYSDEAVAFAREALAPLIRSLGDAGLGSISEIFDGDEPHLPKGAIAQAWSVAEVLRVLADLDP